MKTKQKETKLDTTITLLPMASIVKALKIQSETLLNYEKEEILHPRKKEDESRYYSLDDLEKARLTKILTKSKIMKLQGVKILFSFLDKIKLKPEDYSDYIQSILKTAKHG